jgi:hypothetical protein
MWYPRSTVSTLPKSCRLLVSHSNFLIKSHLTTRSSSSVSTTTSPFAVLGLDDTKVTTLTYDEVKKAFLQLALKYHPDRPGGSADKFRQVHHAFKRIRELPNGTLVCVDDIHTKYDKNWTEQQQRHDDSVQKWMNHNLSFYMNSMTRKEISHVAKTMAPGGLDKGGMWELARLVSMQEDTTNNNHSKDVPPPIELAVGELKKSETRRKRR